MPHYEQPADRGHDLTIAELAELKSVSTKTVRRWIAAGSLDAYRVGARLIRIRAESITRLESPLGWAGH